MEVYYIGMNPTNIIFYKVISSEYAVIEPFVNSSKNLNNWHENLFLVLRLENILYRHCNSETMNNELYANQNRVYV